jgi:hypothetical protein
LRILMYIQTRKFGGAHIRHQSIGCQLSCIDPTLRLRCVLPLVANSVFANSNIYTDSQIRRRSYQTPIHWLRLRCVLPLIPDSVFANSNVYTDSQIRRRSYQTPTNCISESLISVCCAHVVCPSFKQLQNTE